MDAAWPFAKDIANCRPAARQVKNVTAKSKIASHSFFGFEEAEDCQEGAGELSGEAGLNSLAGGGNPFSLFTRVLDALALRTERPGVAGRQRNLRFGESIEEVGS
jgi:hypothetical protein